MERHTHNMYHEHNRGNMDITGSFRLIFGGAANALKKEKNGCFTVNGTKTNYNRIGGFTDVSSSDPVFQYAVDGNTPIEFKASDGWTGQVSGPLDTSGNAIYNTGINSGRTWDTTHGKQIGVRYLIKAL